MSRLVIAWALTAALLACGDDRAVTVGPGEPCKSSADCVGPHHCVDRSEAAQASQCEVIAAPVCDVPGLGCTCQLGFASPSLGLEATAQLVCND